MNRRVFRILWAGVGFLVASTVLFFFLGRSVWGDQVFAPNYAASMAGATLGAALSLIVVMISFTITQRHRQEELGYARFAFLRRQGEELWQAYITFCESLGANTSNITGISWNSTDRGIWPDTSRASSLHRTLKKQLETITSSPGGQTLFLRSAYDDVFAALSDSAIFEGENSLKKDMIEAWRQFGWAASQVQDYQSRIGWTAQNWPGISDAIERTSESVSKALASLSQLASKVRIQ
jgi:hypothetical protein